MKYVKERVQAVRLGEFLEVCTDAELQEWVHLHVTDVDFALVVIDKINLLLIIHCLSLVYFDNLLLL